LLDSRTTLSCALDRPLSAIRAERRVANTEFDGVGFYPFRGPDAPLALRIDANTANLRDDERLCLLRRFCSA